MHNGRRGGHSLLPRKEGPGLTTNGADPRFRSPPKDTSVQTVDRRQALPHAPGKFFENAPSSARTTQSGLESPSFRGSFGSRSVQSLTLGTIAIAMCFASVSPA